MVLFDITIMEGIAEAKPQILGPWQQLNNSSDTINIYNPWFVTGPLSSSRLPKSLKRSLPLMTPLCGGVISPCFQVSRFLETVVENSLNLSVYSTPCSRCWNGILHQPWKLTNHPWRKIQCGLTLYSARKSGVSYTGHAGEACALSTIDNALPTLGWAQHVPSKCV